MDINYLINYLRLEGLHDLECIPTVSEEDGPPARDELIDKEGDSKEEGDDPTEVRPMEEADPEEDPSDKEPMEEEDPDEDLEEDHNEREPIEEEDPEEDPEENPSEGEPMEEDDPDEDPEEDSEVSEG